MPTWSNVSSVGSGIAPPPAAPAMNREQRRALKPAGQTYVIAPPSQPAQNSVNSRYSILILDGRYVPSPMAFFSGNYIVPNSVAARIRMTCAQWSAMTRGQQVQFLTWWIPSVWNSHNVFAANIVDPTQYGASAYGPLSPTTYPLGYLVGDYLSALSIYCLKQGIAAKTLAAVRTIRPAGNVTPWTTPNNGANIPVAQQWVTYAMGLSTGAYDATVSAMAPADQITAVASAWQAIANIYNALMIEANKDPVYIGLMQTAYGGPGMVNVFQPGKLTINVSPNNGYMAAVALEMYSMVPGAMSPPQTNWWMVIPFQVGTGDVVQDNHQNNGPTTNFPNRVNSLGQACTAGDYTCGGWNVASSGSSPMPPAVSLNLPLANSLALVYQIALALNNTDLGVLVNNALAADPSSSLTSPVGTMSSTGVVTPPSPPGMSAPTSTSFPSPITVTTTPNPGTGPVSTYRPTGSAPLTSGGGTSATGTPASCTLPSNVLYGTPGYNDPYFQNEAARDLWISQNPTCTIPPPLQVAPAQPVIATPVAQTGPQYVPGMSLYSATCQVPLGLPVTEASAIQWSQANPTCQPIFVATDQNGNPVLASTSSPIQNVPQPGIAGIPWWAWVLGGAALVGTVAVVANSTKEKPGSRRSPGSENEAPVA